MGQLCLRLEWCPNGTKNFWNFLIFELKIFEFHSGHHSGRVLFHISIIKISYCRISILWTIDWYNFFVILRILSMWNNGLKTCFFRWNVMKILDFFYFLLQNICIPFFVRNINLLPNCKLYRNYENIILHFLQHKIIQCY